MWPWASIYCLGKEDGRMFRFDRARFCNIDTVVEQGCPIYISVARACYGGSRDAEVDIEEACAECIDRLASVPS